MVLGKLSLLKKVLQISGIVTGFAAVAVMATLYLSSTNEAGASDCSANAIVKCGFRTAPELINDISSNGPDGTQKDLATIYSSYGLTSADYNRFVTAARPGVAYKNGTIVVDGQIVATGANSIGREQKANSTAKVIGGTTYWQDSAQNVFISDSVPVMVLFDTTGKMQFAVMTDCGNPTNGTAIQPTYGCNQLNERQVDRTTYAFSTVATAGNGASINHVVYDYGDGKIDTRTNPVEQVRHTYASAGDYTVKVTVYINVPGTNTIVIAAAGDCVRKVTVIPVPLTPPPPPKPPTPLLTCTKLTIFPTTDRTNFMLQATAEAANGATITSYTFHVRNLAGTTDLQVKDVPTTATTASVPMTIDTPADYSVQVYVNGSVGTVSSRACMGNVTVQPAPTASCQQITITPLDRTTYKINAVANATNGASITGYTFIVLDSTGATVATSTVNSVATHAATNVTVSKPGEYTAVASVATNLGIKTSPACNVTFTVPEQPIPPVPSVKITKTVDGVKAKQVGLAQNFSYQLVILNDGKVNLNNVAVTDQPQAGITLVSSDVGTITGSGTGWNYTIPTLAINQTVTYTITATVQGYVAGSLVNTACVNAVEVNPTQPTQSDGCDTASVTVPTPTTVVPVTNLPNTGASNVVSIFTVSVIVGGLAYRLFLNRRLER